MAHGGKRDGAGRPAGSKTLKLLELLEEKGKKEETDYVGEFLEFLIDNYKEDARLMIWMGDHLFGKAPQAVDVTSLGEAVAIAGFIFVKNGDPHPDNPPNA